MEWESRFEVGVEMIDEQHKELFDRLSRLEAAMRSNDATEVTKLLDFLGLYVVKHFSAEEAEMEAQKYPRRDAHTLAHDHFIQELLAMKSAFAANGETMPLSTLVHGFMSTWLRQHILVMDQELAGHLSAPQKKAAARSKRAPKTAAKPKAAKSKSAAKPKSPAKRR